MRKGLTLLIFMIAFGLLPSSAFGQYPYQYGPMPVRYGQSAQMPAQYVQPYGYQMPAQYGHPYGVPMSAQHAQRYGYQAPMYAQPPVVVHYPPAPQPSSASAVLPAQSPKVYHSAAQVQEGVNSSNPSSGARPLPIVTRIQPDTATTTTVEINPAVPLPSEPKGGGFTAGGGMYLLRPHFQSNPAFQVTSVVPGAPVRGTQREFDYALSVSPHATAGYETASGLGICGAWWRFDDNARATATVGLNEFITAANPLNLGAGLPTVPADVIVAASRLRLDVFDLEMTQKWRASDVWSFMVGGGARYARVSQEYGFSAVTPGFGTTGTVNSSHVFKGVGPALSLESHRSFCNSGFGFYGTGRGTVLFGQLRQRSDLSAVNLAGVFAPAASNDSSQSHVMPTVEFEVGAEYRYVMGRAQMLFQSGFVGQSWFGAGNSSNTDTTFTGNSNNNLNLGFMGLAVRASVQY